MTLVPKPCPQWTKLESWGGLGIGRNLWGVTAENCYSSNCLFLQISEVSYSRLLDSSPPITPSLRSTPPASSSPLSCALTDSVTPQILWDAVLWAL